MKHSVIITIKAELDEHACNVSCVIEPPVPMELETAQFFSGMVDTTARLVLGSLAATAAEASIEQPI